MKVTLSPQETVTVIDPRHPLFDRTLPLIGITNKPYLGSCCVVWLPEGFERIVPLAATDRSADPITAYPLPLDLSSVEQLLATYDRIRSQAREEVEDGSTQPGDKQAQAINTPVGSMDSRASEATRTGLGLTHPPTAAPGISDDRLAMPSVTPQPQSGGGR